MKHATIHISVNDCIQISEVPVNQSLLSYLRDTLNLTAVKNGCNGGECGACMVLLNDEPVNSCMVLAVECDGQKVDTLEGLNQEGLMQFITASLSGSRRGTMRVLYTGHADIFLFSVVKQPNPYG